jgi:uncharacterized protein (DUF2147 family)
MFCLRVTAVALCLSAAALLTVSFGRTAGAADAFGTWLTGDKEGQVRIVNCGGVPVVLAMKPSGPGQWSGEVYNAEDGKTYSGSFTLTGPDTADVKGCVLSILCKSQTWTRVH